METQTTKRYYGNAQGWRPSTTGKSESDRRGIAISVAVNNVFGNLTFTELQDIALNSDKLNRLLGLSKSLAQLQVEFTGADS